MTYRHTFDDPDRFVTGTLGEPGSRVFYLQARQDGRIVSVVVEKEQVRAMADHFESTLDQLSRFDLDLHIPPAQDVPTDLAPLELPLVEEFRVGTIGIGWDPASERFLVELASVAGAVDEPDPADLLASVAEAEPDESLTVLLTPAQARDFVPRARYFVQAGRPPCPFCQQPISADGHICPRADGYRRLGT